MTKEEYLEKHVFNGLANRNDGFDQECIKYFAESDFETVLQRVEHLGIGLFGIEPWKDRGYYDVRTHEDYGLGSRDPKWFRRAFAEFKERDNDLLYAASYDIPEHLLGKKE